MAAKRKKTSDGNTSATNSNKSLTATDDIEDFENESDPFSKPWEGSDAILVVENKKLYVHSNMLSFSSPVFKSMFNSGYFKESKTKTVDLKGKKYADVVNLLKMIYPQFEIDLWMTTISELQVMMTLIEEYLIKSLRKRIEDHTLYIANIKILNGGYQEVCALDLMLLADLFNFNDTIDQCAKYIGARYYYTDHSNESTFSMDTDDEDTEDSPSMKEFFQVHKLTDKAKLKIMVNIGKKHLEFIEEERDDMYKEMMTKRTREHSYLKSEMCRRKMEDLKIVMNEMTLLIK